MTPSLDLPDQVRGDLPASTRRQMRRNILVGCAAFVLLMALTLTMLFTPLFDGHIGGIGVGYVIGFIDFVAVLGIAATHCVRMNRVDTRGGVL
ncbi:hypothetical protein [Gordonia polyisoprenivorans]|nr:hypothetical protein [Gordonia polyisoprenivorans]NKY02897.1 hypothetical protein [Gordonia polyisoprenivorans]WCB37239.1 hypothetical protein PHA63_24895 [Gordonia polyisoprenivorans]